MLRSSFGHAFGRQLASPKCCNCCERLLVATAPPALKSIDLPVTANKLCPSLELVDGSPELDAEDERSTQSSVCEAEISDRIGVMRRRLDRFDAPKQQQNHLPKQDRCSGALIDLADDEDTARR